MPSLLLARQLHWHAQPPAECWYAAGAICTLAPNPVQQPRQLGVRFERRASSGRSSQSAVSGQGRTR